MMILWMWLSALAAVPDLYQQSYEQEALGAYRTALGALDSLPAEEKSSYTYTLRRGWLLYLDGQLDASVQAYDQAITRAAEAIEPRLGKMLPLLAARRWADAEKVGRDVLARDAKSYLGRSRLAWALYNLGRYGEAETLYRGLLADYPSDVEMRAGLAWTLLKLGKKEDALKLFDEVLKIAPRHASAAAGRDAAR